MAFKISRLLCNCSTKLNPSSGSSNKFLIGHSYKSLSGLNSFHTNVTSNGNMRSFATSIIPDSQLESERVSTTHNFGKRNNTVLTYLVFSTSK